MFVGAAVRGVASAVVVVLMRGADLASCVDHVGFVYFVDFVDCVGGFSGNFV